MGQDQLILRASPFQFLKRLIAIEFFFAIFPFFLAWLINFISNFFSDSYAGLPFSRSLSFTLFSVIIFTTIQVFIIALTFVAWYFPVYVINHDEIVQQRGTLFGNRKLANSQDVTDIILKQSKLGKGLNYGTLVINTIKKADQAKLKDIPEPEQKIEQLKEFLAFGQIEVEEFAHKSASELIIEGEHQYVEFKSSFVWDYHQQRANKALHEPVMKTIVAFLNSAGGYLLIGVADDGKILGLAPDLQTLGKSNLDGFETAFNMTFNKMIGVEFRQFVDVAFPNFNGLDICVIQVQPSPEPVFLQSKGMEKFYIRAGNASQSLTISQANRYIKQRFS